MIKITFIDSNYVEFPRGAVGSIVAFGELDTIYEIMDAWLDSTMGEGKEMNWMTAVSSASKTLDAAKVMVTKDVDRHVGPELRVWMEHKRIDVVGAIEPQTEYVTLEPMEQAEQDREYTRFTRYAEPPTPRMTEIEIPMERTEPLMETSGISELLAEYEASAAVEEKPTKVSVTKEMELSDAIRSGQ